MSVPTDAHSDPVPRQSSLDTVRRSSDVQGPFPDSPMPGNDPKGSTRHSEEQQNPSTTAEGASQVDPGAPVDQPPVGTSSAHTDEQTVPSPPSAQPPSSAPESSTDDPKLKEKPEDTVSLSTVATKTQTPRNSRRKANKSSVSEGASASTSTNIHSPNTNGKAKTHSTSKPKPSFLIKLVRRIAPCISVSPRGYDVELDDSQALTPREKEKPSASKDSPKAVGAPDDKPGEVLSAPPRTSTGPPLPPLAIPPASPPADAADVVVSSTPTLLPKSETEGVTSGAVQPPGSTGESLFSPHPQQQHGHAHGHDHARAHTRDASADAGDESDETSFTEEEDAEESGPAEEPEDEEDRLILNGGAGIPIGPVSTSASSIRPL